MKRFLITTALEETWCQDKPVLFLGEWCRLYDRKDHWANMDAEVLPYHWDDRSKLYADYLFLQELYERLLADLSQQLNQIHGVNHGARYWRILVGVWLGFFTQTLFDRWHSIQQISKRTDLAETIVLTGHEMQLIPSDMTDFIRLFLGDEWNHHIYALLIQKYTSIPCVNKKVRQCIKPKAKAALKRRIKSVLAACYSKIAHTLSKDDDAFFMSTYMPLADELRMYLRMGQIPQLWHTKPLMGDSTANLNQRKWTVTGDSRSEFEVCARNLIPMQIPIAYLEGYGRLAERCANLPWPKTPKLIWTSNAHFTDDIFNAWAADKTEQGAPLVIGQHGGLLDIGRWAFFEDHEITISDCYLSWGWTRPGQPKIKPVGQLKSKRPLGIQHANQSHALLVTTTAPRQSYHMYSGIVSRQWLDYFEDQCVFVRCLPASIRNQLIVRLCAADLGWCQYKRWRERFPDLQLDEGQSNINSLIRKSRLFIATYNGTAHLESFTMNVPTVIYWNPTHWELSDSAIPYFDELKRVGIFHETPESAARHVAAIWGNIDAWWASPEVRKVLERFKARYALLPDDLLDRVEHVLHEVMVDAEKTIPQ